MEHQPKTEPGFGSSDHRNLEDMNIQELVLVLRTAFMTEDFDRVEEVLVSRYNRLQTEILHLQKKFELEKLRRVQAEEDLRKREELCERGKKAQNNYEKLLKEIKEKTSLTERDNIGEVRKKNDELELEVCELRKLKEKWMDDSNALSELRIKIAVLENHKDASGVQNNELEKSMKKKNVEALAADHGTTDFENKDEENVADFENNDTVVSAPLQPNELPNKGNKNVQVMTRHISIASIRKKLVAAGKAVVNLHIGKCFR